jgi:hypothetical protein
LFGDRRRIQRVIEGAGSASPLTRLILDFALGRIAYRPLRRRMMARAPLLAVHLVRERLKAWSEGRHGAA